MSSISHNLPPLTLNLKTAGPLLRLLVAQHDLEEDCLQPESAWNVFKLFCALPAAVASDVISFQATWTPDDAPEVPDPETFWCTWSRELTDSTESWFSTIAVQIQWQFRPDGDELEEREVWSDQYPDLPSFFRSVETSPQFRALLTSNALASLYTVDVDR